ncbi:2-amino-3-ketobutyrate coenzyme A ligase [Thecamonas trahens ATCC 50062]|uniref:2-amino-3-ketobutyrate coenzyme A ligase n=1 Tax=Thecamonas trahens ATCC 50062 TaxID=461836 RepID=A0A0L0D842_THETB|nr:2-amino-3-ketobutyrate coenzyme A ligase [Thecamonas trahens ATCC 50062]KNC48542.1 2-amino-3-ketobutyrate coenzyme A ligase [Thecamonas trahens ATCC 50062]|eukprot:XP_013758649.1 2-amino-3-ketobutyrate coenzyme A ligase [Thecamonas trahens ATCC 50062]
MFALPRTLVTAQFARTAVRAKSNAAAKLDSLLATELEGIREAGTYKNERVITSMQAAEVDVGPDHVINLCANNYLGLCDHPELIQAGKDALDSHGLGLASVRFICGTQDIHKELEANVAKFHGMDDAILYAACFDANAGIFEALFTPDDLLISDELNHASIIDGMRLAKCRKTRFAHMDMHDLEEKLKAGQDARQRLIVTDGVFSMDGDIAPLEEIVKLAQEYDALVMVDECHATGFLGATGRGTPEYCGVADEIDIVNSTLGKALGGGSGGYTTASQAVVDVLRQRSRPQQNV